MEVTFTLRQPQDHCGGPHQTAKEGAQNVAAFGEAPVAIKLDVDRAIDAPLNVSLRDHRALRPVFDRGSAVSMDD